MKNYLKKLDLFTDLMKINYRPEIDGLKKVSNGEEIV